MPDFGTELTRAAAEIQVVPRLVSEHPREWRLGPLTVVVGARGPAQLRYARLAVARSAATLARSIQPLERS